MRATTCGGRVCVYVCFDSGTAAREVSLISWQEAHWTTDRELNLLLMKLCSNTSRQNCSTVLLWCWLLPRCLLVFVRTRFTPGFSPAIVFSKFDFFSFFYTQIPCSEPNWAPTKECHNRYIFLGAHRRDSRTCLKFSQSETRPVKKVHSHCCLYAAAKLVSLFVFALFSVKYKLLQCWIVIWNMNKVAVAIIRSSQAHSCSCERRSLCLQAAANQKKTGLKGEELKLFFQTEVLHQGPTSANHEKLL